MSLANIKRRAVQGAKIEMVYHSIADGRTPDGIPVPVKLRGIREIAHVQGNAVQFSGGSWLWWPKSSQIRETEAGFEVSLIEEESSDTPLFSQSMRYEWR